MTKYENIFNALGDSTRRAIFEKLSKGPLAVVDIAKKLPVTRPAVSQHLRVLMDAGLVTAQQKGTRNYYQLDPQGIAAMCNYLDRMWDAALHAFKLVAENEEEKKK